MAGKSADLILATIAQSYGPAVEKFAEYAAGEFWSAVRRHALAMGCNPAEAEGVAVLVVRAAVKTMAGAVQQAEFERRFRKPG